MTTNCLECKIIKSELGRQLEAIKTSPSILVDNIEELTCNKHNMENNKNHLPKDEKVIVEVTPCTDGLNCDGATSKGHYHVNNITEIKGDSLSSTENSEKEPQQQIATSQRGRPLRGRRGRGQVTVYCQVDKGQEKKKKVDDKIEEKESQEDETLISNPAENLNVNKNIRANIKLENTKKKKRKKGALNDDDSESTQNTKRVKTEVEDENVDDDENSVQSSSTDNNQNDADMTALIIEENDPILTGIQMTPHIDEENFDMGNNGDVGDNIQKEITGILTVPQDHIITTTTTNIGPCLSIPGTPSMIQLDIGHSSIAPHHKIEHNYPKLVLVDSTDHMEEEEGSENKFTTLTAIPPTNSLSPMTNFTTSTINLQQSGLDFGDNVQYFIVEDQVAQQGFSSAVHAVVINHETLGQDGPTIYNFQPTSQRLSQLTNGPEVIWREVKEEDTGIINYQLSPLQENPCQFVDEGEDTGDKSEIFSDMKDDSYDSLAAEEERPKKKKKKSNNRGRTQKGKQVDGSICNLKDDGRLLCSLCNKTFKNKNVLYNHRSIYHRAGGNGETPSSSS